MKKFPLLLVLAALILFLPGCGANQGAVGREEGGGVTFTPYPPMPNSPSLLAARYSLLTKDSQNLSLSSNWSTISFPFDSLISTGSFAYSLQAWVDGSYRDVNPNTGAPSIDCRQGYWAYTIAPATIPVNGNYLPNLGAVTLHAGWNLIGFPRRYNLSFDKIVLSYNGELKSLSQCASTDTNSTTAWFYGIIQYYKNARWYQLKYDNPANLLQPGKGYWVFSWKEGLVFYFQKPRLNALNPASGYPGTPVTLSGLDFGSIRNNGSVDFNGAFADIVSWSDTQIICAVPAGATSGGVTVSAGGSAGNSLSFTVNGISKAVSGMLHSLALKGDGSVYSWGSNFCGQLGNGTTTDSNSPARVPDLSNVKALAAGGYHNLALKNDGSVWAWGNNYAGQLGNGEASGDWLDHSKDKTAPVQVSGLTSGVAAIVAGGIDSFAIKADGSIWAWGDNYSGNLGTGDNANRNTPTRIFAPGSGIISLAAGWGNTLALKSDGTLLAWGFGRSGQLGNGAWNNTNSPVAVPGLSGVKAITASIYDHVFALKSDGSLWGWGYNHNGELGIGNYDNQNTPVQVLSGVAGSGAGGFHGLALKSDGSAWAWGDNESGDLGDGTFTGTNRPVAVSGMGSGVIYASGGLDNSLALKTDNTLWAWGDNEYGQLGDATNENKNTPVQIFLEPAVISIQAGYQDTAALMNNGTLYIWGYNGRGELGSGDNTERYTPQALAAFNDVKQAALGFYHTLILRKNGNLYACGMNMDGQLGVGNTNNYNYPIQISSLSDIVAIGAGSNHSLALKSDGTVYAWGDNSYGQLGNGSPGDSRITPAQVSGLTNVIALAGGDTRSLALKADGSVWTWGTLSRADGGYYACYTPMQVSNLANIKAIASGRIHDLALRRDGALFAWGSNGDGQLGLGSIPGDTTTPMQITGLSNIVSISAGYGHSLAARADGAVFAWGWNGAGYGYGQLGLGDYDYRDTPTRITSLSNITLVAAGAYHSFALQGSATLWSWGLNDWGALGDGTGTSRNTPAQVTSF